MSRSIDSTNTNTIEEMVTVEINDKGSKDDTADADVEVSAKQTVEDDGIGFGQYNFNNAGDSLRPYVTGGVKHVQK